MMLTRVSTADNVSSSLLGASPRLSLSLLSSLCLLFFHRASSIASRTRARVRVVPSKFIFIEVFFTNTYTYIL